MFPARDHRFSLCIGWQNHQIPSILDEAHQQKNYFDFLWLRLVFVALKDIAEINVNSYATFKIQIKFIKITSENALNSAKRKFILEEIEH